MNSLFAFKVSLNLSQFWVVRTPIWMFFHKKYCYWLTRRTCILIIDLFLFHRLIRHSIPLLIASATLRNPFKSTGESRLSCLLIRALALSLLAQTQPNLLSASNRLLLNHSINCSLLPAPIITKIWPAVISPMPQVAVVFGHRSLCVHL